jgi:hypothetical protein
MTLQKTPVMAPDFLEKLRVLTLAQKFRREG